MIKWIAFLLAALLLTGCTDRKAVPPTSNPASQQTVDPSAGTEPADPGIYESDSPLRQKHLQVYNPNAECCTAMVPTQDGMILLCGEEQTTLTVYRGENLVQAGSISLDRQIRPEELQVRSDPWGLAYFDGEAMVVLDADLRISQQIELPQKAIGPVLMSADWKTVWYPAEDGIYALDLGTGLPRIVKQEKLARGTELQLLFGDQLLSCTGPAEQDGSQTQYLLPENGSTVHITPTLPLFAAGEERYFFVKPEGSVIRYGTGKRSTEPCQLMLEGEAYPVLGRDAVLTVQETHSSQVLTLVDLESLQTVSSLTLPVGLELLQAEGNREAVWLLTNDAQTGSDRLLRWQAEPEKDGKAILASAYELRQSPDAKGLLACREKAAQLGQTYGVRILTANEPASFSPAGYEVTTEYLVQVWQRDLERLEACLQRFPQDFLLQAAAGSREEKLTISLVRSVDNGTQHCPGLQYWIDESACLMLPMGPDLEKNFYHAMMHVIDNRVLGSSTLYDEWDQLNPEDFAYDMDYERNAKRDPQEKNPAFLDTFSMSFPREDRAAIFACAMMEDCGDLFQSEILQQKLLRLCNGIREGFELDGSEIYPWEQYLAQPIEAEED